MVRRVVRRPPLVARKRRKEKEWGWWRKWRRRHVGEHIYARGERACVRESKSRHLARTRQTKYHTTPYLDVKHLHRFIAGGTAALPVPARPGTTDTEIHVVRIIVDNHANGATLLDQPARLRAPTRAVRARHHQPVVAHCDISAERRLHPTHARRRRAGGAKARRAAAAAARTVALLVVGHNAGVAVSARIDRTSVCANWHGESVACARTQRQTVLLQRARADFGVS